MMNMLVRMTSEIETNMVSAERIMEYQETPQEAPYEVDGNSNIPKNIDFLMYKKDSISHKWLLKGSD